MLVGLPRWLNVGPVIDAFKRTGDPDVKKFMMAAAEEQGT